MTPMKKKSVLFLLALALGSLALAQGKEAWQKKEYRQLSEKECRKLLENSPWAQSYTLSQVFVDRIEAQPLERTSPATGSDTLSIPEPNRSDGTGRAREARPQIIYQAQFRSAPPIRQALVRLSEISAKYDQMQPDQQRAVDQQAEVFLAKRFPDTVVLYVSYRSNVQLNDRALALHWQAQTTDTLKNSVFLIGSGGEKVPLLNYTAIEGGGRAFQLTFPREYKDRPLIGPQDKTLQLELPHPSIRGQSKARILIVFKVEKMLIDGDVVY